MKSMCFLLSSCCLLIFVERRLFRKLKHWFFSFQQTEFWSILEEDTLHYCESKICVVTEFCKLLCILWYCLLLLKENKSSSISGHYEKKEKIIEWDCFVLLKKKSKHLELQIREIDFKIKAKRLDTKSSLEGCFNGFTILATFLGRPWGFTE